MSISKGDGTDANKKLGIFPCPTNTTVRIENVYATVSGAPTANAWTHVVVTCDGTTGKVYINGVLGATVTVSSILEDCTDLIICGRAASENFATYSTVFDGKISDVRIYSTCLSADDVSNIYKGKI